MTPPKHVNFKAKKLFGQMGQIVDGAIAYISLDGGGPVYLQSNAQSYERYRR